MTFTARRPGATFFAFSLAAAVACAGIAALPAHASAEASASVAPTTRHSSTPEARAQHARAERVPVWVTLGGGSNVRGATVRVFDSTGTVVDKATTNASGFAFLHRSKLPSGPFTVKVGGGTSLASAGVRELSGREWIGKSQSKALAISPVTSMAYQAAKQQGISYSAAMKKIKASLQIPSWTTPIQANTSAVFFSGPAFLAWAKSHGGVNASMRSVIAAALAGTPSPSFARPAVLKTSRHKVRSEETTAMWLTGEVIDGVIGGAMGSATEVTIGDILGASNESSSDVSDIATELSDIVTQLNTISKQQQELIALVSTANFNSIETTVSDVVDKTTAQWAVYQSLLSEYGTTNFDSDAKSFADDWWTDFNGGIDDYQSLLTTAGSEGLLQAAYGVYPYTYWTSTEVNNLTATIQYYGTVYGETVALLNEAWWERGQSDSYINTENAGFTALSTSIYAETPTAIDDSTIVNPSTQVMYRAWPATVQEVWENTSRGNNENPSCNSKGSVMTYGSNSEQIWPYVQPANTNWTALWQGKLSDQSWTVSPSSDFTWLQQSRTVNNQTQWTLPTLVSGAPTGWVLVGSDTQPIGGFNNTTVSSVSYDSFANFMWCYSTSASLVVSKPNSWEYNVATDTSGHDTYPGTAAKQGTPAPVGILAHKSGKFQY